MPTAHDPPAPLVLFASDRSRALVNAIRGAGNVVAHAPTGGLAIDIAQHTNPDVIVVDAELPDMPGLEACRILRNDPAVKRTVPLLVAVQDQPTPEQRVNALRVGAWDFVRLLDDPAETALKIRAYAHAKRNIEEQTDTVHLGLPAGMDASASLARSATQVGALMFRLREALACVVFEWDHLPPGVEASALVARAARTSDFVGELGTTRCGIIAPATNHAGAVLLATRVADSVRTTIEARAVAQGTPSPGSRLLVGYDAVANAAYSPLNPMSLIAHAAAAVHSGNPEPGHIWVRRHDDSAAAPAAAASLELRSHS